MTRYKVILERAGASWGAHVPDMLGCVAVAESRTEVVGLIQAALSMHIEGLREQGATVPEPNFEGEIIEVEAS